MPATRVSLPVVEDDRLILPQSTANQPASIVVGSHAWYAWLHDQQPRSFAFQSAHGTFTARYERQRNAWYWYAYRRHQGKLHKAYLGRATELSLERLCEVAANLAQRAATPSAQPSLPIADRGTTIRHDPIITTKLTPPVVPARLVPRPHALAHLDAGVQGKLTLLVAPAGFGKTTLLNAWVRSQANPSIWLALDADDNDPTRFWTYVITALRRQHPHVGADALTLLHSYQPPVLESILTTLINELAALHEDIAIILDDYHLISAEPIHARMRFLLDHLPPSIHLVIATRVNPPFPLARLRAKGQLIEVQATDLRFAPDEIAAFLNDIMTLELPADAINTLATSTEGWIAGLQLAALSLQRHPDRDRFIAGFSGHHHAILDYLIEEVLQQQPDQVQQFLLQTAILDRLSGPLCDVLIDDQTTSTSPSQQMLAYLERANLFLFPLDDERHWYRYHALFADALRNRLQQTDPARMVDLHRRAAHWFAQQGMLPEAINHALTAHDYDQAAHEIECIAQSVLMRGETTTLQTWLAALPDTVIQNHPHLLLIHAQLLAITMQIEAAEGHLTAAEALLQTAYDPLLAGEIAAVRALIATIQFEPSQVIGYARQALHLLPTDQHFLRGITALGLGISYMLKEDMAAGYQTLAEAARSSQAAGNMLIALIMNHALIMLSAMQGRLSQAYAVYQQARQTLTTSAQHTPLMNLIDLGLGDLQREWNNLDQAEQWVRGSIVAGQILGNTEILADAFVVLARIQQAQGKLESAAQTLAEADLRGRQHGVAALTLIQIAAYQTRLWLAQGRVAAAIQWAKSLDLAKEMTLSNRVSYAQPFVREIVYFTLARVWMAEERFDDALQVIDKALQKAEDTDHLAAQIEGRLLQALIFHAQGDDQTAAATLTEALRRAEPEGFVRLFVDAGAPMAELLAQIAAVETPVASYAARLLTAASGFTTATVPKIQPLVEPLSERELEVLRLIAAGLSNREIADRLVLAVGTVKTHTRNVFGKLEVASRTQAVARARELDILH